MTQPAAPPNKTGRIERKPRPAPHAASAPSPCLSCAARQARCTRTTPALRTQAAARIDRRPPRARSSPGAARPPTARHSVARDRPHPSPTPNPSHADRTRIDPAPAPQAARDPTRGGHAPRSRRTNIRSRQSQVRPRHTRKGAPGKARALPRPRSSLSTGRNRPPKAEQPARLYCSIARMAMTAAAERVSIPSLSKICSRCLVTVRGLMLRISLMTRFGLP